VGTCGRRGVARRSRHDASTPLGARRKDAGESYQRKSRRWNQRRKTRQEFYGIHHPTLRASTAGLLVGGRVGVFALDTGTGRQLAHRSDERFAMCSTFKWALAAAILARVDRAELSLDDRVPYGSSDLLEYAAATREHLAEGSMTVDALARAAVTVSDNTAANLLLAKVGGPAGLTHFVRSLSDPVTRLDRDEPALNANDPGDPRDTTSPRAMVGLMRRVLCGDALSTASRERVLGWLRACETGKDRLRAGLPPGWTVGDKTGSGGRNTINDSPSPYRRGALPSSSLRT
jgi:beta-lactamase class A